MVEVQSQSAQQAEMDEFCRAIGELVLWTSIIDGQLTTAASLMILKDNSMMAETLVGEIEFRRKAELLKTRVKSLDAHDWKTSIRSWIEKAEKVNSNRNVVAHQRPTSRYGPLSLQSHQLTRLLKSQGQEPVGIAQVLRWIEEAKSCHEEGSVVLGNLEDFSKAWAVRQHSNGAGE